MTLNVRLMDMFSYTEMIYLKSFGLPLRVIHQSDWLTGKHHRGYKDNDVIYG